MLHTPECPDWLHIGELAHSLSTFRFDASPSLCTWHGTRETDTHLEMDEHLHVGGDAVVGDLQDLHVLAVGGLRLRLIAGRRRRRAAAVRNRSC